MSTKIFIMTHNSFQPPMDSMYIPLHVGRGLSTDLGYWGDHSGESISERNRSFCELTGMYWLWKNYSDCNYIGICHYRRYLINETGSVFTESELTPLLQKYDMITTRLLTLPGSYFDGFRENHHIEDLLLTGEVIRRKSPAYYEVFQELIYGSHTYFGNIFIASKALYDQYCSWLFPILFEVEKNVDFSSYNNYQKRLFGFLSEFLQTVFIRTNHLNTYECKVGMLGEKAETKQLRTTLASYFHRQDYKGAQECFLSSYQKRPDLLMEASDITGELRLCMQIISTCNFEAEEYGHCILDDINDYPLLIRHFARLNMAVNHLLTGEESPEDAAFFRETPFISRRAVDISLRLFEKDTARCQAILLKIEGMK